MEELVVERNIWIAASRETVWRALTEPEQLKQWYAPGCRWEIPALQVGATIKFYNTDTDIQSAVIEVVDRPRQLTLRWETDPSLPAVSFVNSFILVDENGGTRTTITQSGYDSLPEAVRDNWLAQDNEAYTAIAQNLKTHIERVPS